MVGMVFGGRGRSGAVLVRAAVALSALVLWAAVFGGVARAEGRAAVQTKTFGDSKEVRVPGRGTSGKAAPYPARLRVEGFGHARTLDVSVGLRGFTDTFPDDVDVLLVSPAGRTAILMSDAGGRHAARNLDLRINDAAGTPMPDSGPLRSGAYTPTNYDAGLDGWPGAPRQNGNRLLYAFDGENPNGVWRLYAYDDAQKNGGRFAGGWSLQITAQTIK